MPILKTRKLRLSVTCRVMKLVGVGKSSDPLPKTNPSNGPKATGPQILSAAACLASWELRRGSGPRVSTSLLLDGPFHG